MADIDDHLRQDLQDAEFSEGYAESFLDTYVATQLKVLREQRQLTQKDVATKMRTSQGVVSRFEDAEYAAWNINTLKKFARLYEVRLHISFETYGSLIGEIKRFSRKTLERAPRHADPVLRGSSKSKKPSAQFEDYQMSLFADANRCAGAGAASMSALPVIRAPKILLERPKPIKAGATVYYLDRYRPEKSGAGLGINNGAAHA